MIGFIRIFGRSGWILLAVVWLLTSCAWLKPAVETGRAARAEPREAAPVEEIAPDEAVSPPAESLTSDQLFRILLGEIAGQRGRMDVSVPAYLEAAKKSQDPRVAQRAVKIAVFGQDQNQAYEAARRWVELAPNNIEARQAVAALALHRGEEAVALEQLEYLLDRSRDKETAWQTALGLLAREPDKARATAVMEKLVEPRDEEAGAHYVFAQLAVHHEDWETASREVRRSLALDPDKTEAVILGAQIELKQGNIEQAHKNIRQALDRHPDDVELRKAYARLLIDEGDLDGAREQYEWLVKRQPDDGQIVYSLGLLTLEDGRLREAEGHFKRLLELEYQVQPAYYYLGAISEERNDYSKAVKWYKKVEPGDHWLEVQIRLAKIESETGELPTARARLKNLRLTNPVHAERLLLVEGDLLVRAGHDADAFELYTGFLESHPDNFEVRYARSLVAESVNRLDVAERDLLMILDKEPDNARALNALGYTLADRTTRYEEALGYIEKAYAQSPDDAAVVDSMGWVHYRLGQLDKAREYLKKAYELNQDAEIGAHLGEVLWSLGDKAAARAVWKKARETDPDDRTLVETLRRLDP
jgi:tetratricopeptide (TPR) repeat protein